MTCRTRPQAVPFRPFDVSPTKTASVPIAFDLVVGAAADRVTGGSQYLDQESDRIGLAFRRDGSDDVTCETVIRFLCHDRPRGRLCARRSTLDLLGAVEN
jgi:hypothetical protein